MRNEFATISLMSHTTALAYKNLDRLASPELLFVCLKENGEETANTISSATYVT